MASVQLFDTALAQADLSAFAVPVSVNVYHEARCYWGWAVGQYAHGGGAANSTMNQTKNGYMFTAMRTGTIDKWYIHLRQDVDGEGYSLGNGGVLPSLAVPRSTRPTTTRTRHKSRCFTPAGRQGISITPIT